MRLNAPQTAALLPYPELAAVIASTLAEFAAGALQIPDRHHIPLGGKGVLLVMPAADKRIAITKLATVHPDNGPLGLPTIQSELILMDAATGRRLAVLDGAEVTGRRTAGASLLAMQRLADAPEGGHTLCIVGAGTQARAHLEAYAAGLELRWVRICSRTPDRAEDLAAYGRGLGLDCLTAEDPADALPGSSLVVTATTATDPVLDDRDVPDDCCIAAVGAFRSFMAELPAELVHRARLYADTMEGVRAEGGDYIRAAVSWNAVTPLQDVVRRGTEPQPGGPVVYKSVGHAVLDLAAARLAVERLEKQP